MPAYVTGFLLSDTQQIWKMWSDCTHEHLCINVAVHVYYECIYARISTAQGCQVSQSIFFSMGHVLMSVHVVFFCLIYVSTERPAGDGELMMKLTAGQTDGGSETHAQPAFC